MAGDESAPDPIGRLAEDFLTRHRAGEHPDPSEYVRRFPDLADRIRHVFPMLLLMEEAGADGSSGDIGPDAPPGESGRRRLDRVGGYRILREIGRGGMGVVYEAEQVALGRHVALKVLPLHLARQGSAPERFRREARAAAKLHHTNIVPVYEVGEDGDVCFYAMQYIHGQPLDEVLAEVRQLRAAGRRPRTPPPEPDLSPSLRGTVAVALLSGQAASPPTEPPPANCPPEVGGSGRLSVGTGSADGSRGWHYYRSVARVGAQVADALAYAHREGVLHRDIKPANLLLDADGRVWVADFGLAKTDGETITRSGDIVGTVAYMAPERFRGWSDPRSDVYGLGLTLYEMVALRPAFAATDRLQLISQVTHDDPPRLRKLDPHVPRDLATIIAKATDKEPGRRYQTAAEMADDLRRFLEDRPVRARQTGTTERAWRWCRRNPAVALLLTALLTGSFAAALVFRAQRDDIARHAGQLEKDTHLLAAAKARVETALWKSDYSRAKAFRWSGLGGRRFEGLRALADAATLEPTVRSDEWAALLGRHLTPGEAARISPALMLRNEAIACMALTDLRVVREWQALAGPDVEVSIDFSPDLDAYARVEDAGICVRRVADDALVLRLPVDGISECRLIRFSPDGRWLAVKLVAGSGPEFLLWDVTDRSADRKPALGWPTQHNTNAVDFSRDGQWLAVDAADGSIGIYDLTTGKESQRLPTRLPGPLPWCARFDPGGTRLATSSGGSKSVQVWDLTTGRVVRELAHPQPALEPAWSPDGRLLATAGGDDPRVHVWDVQSGRELVALEGHKGSVISVAFHPREDLLVSYGWDGRTRLWDFRGGRELVAVNGYSVRFSRDGRHLAYRDGRRIGLREAAVAEESRPLYGPDPGLVVYSSAFSPDGRLLATASRSGVRLWDAATGRHLAALPGVGRTDVVAFDPVTGGLFTGGRAGLLLWPVRPATGAAGLYQVGPPEPIPLHAPAIPRGMALSRDGNVLAVDLTNWQTVVIHRREGKHFFLDAGNSHAGVVVSPDGRWVATGNYKGSGVHVWDGQTGEHKGEFPAGGTVSLTFSPDSQWLVISEDSESRFYRAGSWQPRPVADMPPNVGRCMAFDRDGRVMAVGFVHGGLVRLVKAGTGEELATLELTPGPSQITGPPSFSPDGSKLLVHHGHEGLRLWDLRKVRARLAEMGLDWDLPPYPPATESEPVRVEVTGLLVNPFALNGLPDWLLDLRDRVAAIDLDPGRAHREKSGEHLRAGRWQQAFDEADKAITLAENDAEAWAIRGRARYELRRVEPRQLKLALTDFDRALKLAPGHGEASHYRGHCHEILGRYRDAVADFAAAFARSPGNTHLLTRRGVNHLWLGDYESGVADLRQVLKSKSLPGDEAAASSALARALSIGPATLRDPAEALRLAEQAEQLAPKSFDAVNTLGVVYYRVGEYEKARNTLIRAAGPTMPVPPAENQFFLAMAHHRLGETADAHACYDRALAWLKARPGLTGHPREQLDSFRAEAEALLKPR